MKFIHLYKPAHNWMTTLLSVGNFCDNLTSPIFKGDISQHLIFAILENLFKPSHLIFRDVLFSGH